MSKNLSPLSRRTFLSLLPSFFLIPLVPNLHARNKPSTQLQRGKANGLFDEHGTCRLPVSFSFPTGTLPYLTCAPTGGYFTVSKFECGALSNTEGYISAVGEPDTPCAFTWIAVA